MTPGKQREFAQLIADPLKFVALCWPDMKLYSKQRDVLVSVKDNVETFVHAANEMGKTRIAAVVAIWFYGSRQPARVVTTSSSETQLEAILWSEIRSLISSSRVKFPWTINHLLVRKQVPGGKEDEYLPQDKMLGYVARVVESFQGHHLPHDRPRTLTVIFDEASGIGDEFSDAADSWAHRKLVIGNPLTTTNFFYRDCKTGDKKDPAGETGLLRKVIHIDGIDSPNVQIGFRRAKHGDRKPPILIPGLLSYQEFVRRDSEWDEVKKTTRLRGHFYEGEEALLYPTSWLDLSQARYDELLEDKEEHSKRKALAMGIDVAMGGRDLTVWTICDEAGVLDQIAMDTPNTMEIPGRTINLMKKWRLKPRQVAIDAGGGGKQIADRLVELGKRIELIAFGSAAEDSQSYANRRAEMFGILRGALDPSLNENPFAIPSADGDLRTELVAMPLMYDSEGRMIMLPKEKRASSKYSSNSLRDLLGGKSPDRSDSLVLALFLMRSRLAKKRKLIYDVSAGGDPMEYGRKMEEGIQERMAEFMAKL